LLSLPPRSLHVRSHDKRRAARGREAHARADHVSQHPGTAVRKEMLVNVCHANRAVLVD